MAHVYTITNKSKRSILSRYSTNTNIVFLNIILFIIFTLLLIFNLIPIDYIAISPGNILAGKYIWTFITSMFMHAPGATIPLLSFHLIANMISLFFIGGLVQKLIGSKRYIYFYLGSGIFASLLYVVSALIFTDQMNTFAVGASGAIFGLLGLLMLIIPNLKVLVMFIVPLKMKYAAPGMLIVLWLISLATDVPIGNMAHLGGFLVGIFYGIYLRKKYKNKTRMISKYFS